MSAFHAVPRCDLLKRTELVVKVHRVQISSHLSSDIGRASMDVLDVALQERAYYVLK